MVFPATFLATVNASPKNAVEQSFCTWLVSPEEVTLFTRHGGCPCFPSVHMAWTDYQYLPWHDCAFNIHHGKLKWERHQITKMASLKDPNDASFFFKYTISCDLDLAVSSLHVCFTNNVFHLHSSFVTLILGDVSSKNEKKRRSSLGWCGQTRQSCLPMTHGARASIAATKVRPS